MAQEAMRMQGAITAHLASTEREYKALLEVAAEQLQASAGGKDITEVTFDALDGALMTDIRRLETRMDRLKEIQSWLQADPGLVDFATSGVSQLAAPSRGLPASVVLSLVAVGGLVVGWLLSALLPAAAVLPIGR